MAKQEKGLGKGLNAIFGNTQINTEKNHKTYKTVAETVAENNENTKTASVTQESHDEQPVNIKAIGDDNENQYDGLQDEKLINENKDNTGSLLIKLGRIQPDKNQPRKYFDEEKLQELADNIKEYGVIEPIVVKESGAFYEIITGERRWRAARMAGLKEIPVVVKKNVDDRTSREMSIIENIQREDLNPVEEALAYQSLIEDFNLTQEEVAKKVSKKRSTITNSLRLLKLDEDVLEMLKGGLITQGHARALLVIEDRELRKKIADKCAAENLSVREIENLVKLDKISKEKKSKNDSPEAEELKRLKILYKDLEKKMKAKLGTKVNIIPKNKDKGKLEIEYYSQDQLDRLYMILNSSRED